MTKSDSIGNLAKSLSIVQGKLQPAAKDSVNPFFKNVYADLNSVWNCCRALLTENGLAVTQLPGSNENGNHTLTTMLMHESGEWISDETILPLTKIDSQSVGSALTYFRRYGLAAIIGIIADDDDDGNHASQPKQQSPSKQPPQTTAKQTDAPTYSERIQNAVKAITELQGTISPLGENESEKDYLASLGNQYKTLLANKQKENK